MSRDEQDDAEAMDEEMVDGDDPTSEHEAIQSILESPRALPFADADITDESLSDRIEQEDREVSARDIDERFADGFTGESESDLENL
jgi:hypothetical protein